MTATSGSPPQRVPAWKRIGLKLKYAQENGPEHSQGSDRDASRPPASLANGATQHPSEEDVRLPKRIKTSPELNGDESLPASNNVSTSSSLRADPSPQSFTRPPNGNGVPTSDSTEKVSQHPGRSQAKHENEDPVQPASEPQDKSRRKSVTFTPETKQEDGFGASAFLQRWGAQQKSSDSKLEDSPSDDSETTTEVTELQSKQQPSHFANPQRSRERAAASQNKKPPYVDYLHAFHTDKATWKFNKKRQKDLLKHLFDIDSLPSTYDEALLQYISGLRGSAARQRVIESALTVLQQIAGKDEQSQANAAMESDIARRDAYRAALHRHLERCEQASMRRDDYDEDQLAELQREAERGRRAEAILGELLEKEMYPDRVVSTASRGSQVSSTNTATDDNQSLNGSSTGNAANSIPTSKRKKRKARTQGSFNDSSDESSENENERPRKEKSATTGESSRTQPAFTAAQRSQQNVFTEPAGKKKIFDDDLLDQMFPKKKARWRR